MDNQLVGERYLVEQEIVKDTKTGLIWQRRVPARRFTWGAAKQYAESLNLAGYSSGWRLPTKEELLGIVEKHVHGKGRYKGRCVGPQINIEAFPDTPYRLESSEGAVWTSSLLTSGDQICVVRFSDGDVHCNYIDVYERDFGFGYREVID